MRFGGKEPPLWVSFNVTSRSEPEEDHLLKTVYSFEHAN